TPANHLRASLTYERQHLWVPGPVVRSSDENQPILVALRSEGELPMSRRHPLRIFETVVVAEKPEENITAPNLVKIHVVGSTVGGRHVFKKERFEEPPQQRIAAQIVTQGRPLRSELLLHTADEETEHGSQATSCTSICWRERCSGFRSSMGV